MCTIVAMTIRRVAATALDAGPHRRRGGIDEGPSLKALGS